MNQTHSLQVPGPNRNPFTFPVNISTSMPSHPSPRSITTRPTNVPCDCSPNHSQKRRALQGARARADLHKVQVVVTNNAQRRPPQAMQSFILKSTRSFRWARTRVVTVVSIPCYVLVRLHRIPLPFVTRCGAVPSRSCAGLNGSSGEAGWIHRSCFEK